ncbi:hypothetical protein Ancab_008188 [Ancistrocladus abbreviatus]
MTMPLSALDRGLGFIVFDSEKVVDDILGDGSLLISLSQDKFLRVRPYGGGFGSRFSNYARYGGVNIGGSYGSSHGGGLGAYQGGPSFVYSGHYGSNDAGSLGGGHKGSRLGAYGTGGDGYGTSGPVVEYGSDPGGALCWCWRTSW